MALEEFPCRLPIIRLPGAPAPSSATAGSRRGQIAPIWPSYHLDMLALAAVVMKHGPVLGHGLVLAGFTAAFVLLAGRRLRRVG